MKKTFSRWLAAVALVFGVAVSAYGQSDVREDFHHLGTAQGLPNAQVNCILQDRQGFIWFATASGLSRFDGFRFRNFFSSAGNELTLPDDNVRRLTEDDDGRLWVGTHSGWCVYDALTETFDRHPDAEQAAAIDGKTRDLQMTDRAGNVWRQKEGRWVVFSLRLRRETANVGELLRGAGIVSTGTDIESLVVRHVKNDLHGRLWVATDHHGLLRIDWKSGQVDRFEHERGKDLSLSDNSVQWLYTDRNGGLWIGTLKNGAAYFSDEEQPFKLVELGDVLTIAEDGQGRLWAGTNDVGIVCYDPATGSSEHFGMKRTGLGSDVVASSLCDSRGRLWFGTYGGGMARYDGGLWTVWRKGTDGLLSDDVWALAEDHRGRIVIGTLNAGLHIYEPDADRWKHFGGMPSNYVPTVAIDDSNNVWMGHSHYYSVLHAATGKITNHPGTADGRQFANPSVNQIMKDSHGLIWIASQSGVNIYDESTGQLELLNADNGLGGYAAHALAEDGMHRVWVVTPNGLSVVTPVRRGTKWAFETLSYNELDGLQRRQFNIRSILLTRKGDVVVGGQDGINIGRLPDSQEEDALHDSATKTKTGGRRDEKSSKVQVLFSGLIMADHALSVGERYNGHVVLRQAINEMKRLDLRHDENYFTIQLATSNVSCTSRPLFLYRMEGSDSNWRRTVHDDGLLAFGNLAPGKYKLQVKPLDRNGREAGETRELLIVVHPPFYFSPWAWLLYAMAAAGFLVWLYRFIMMRQRHRFELEQVRREAEKDRQLDDLKLRFFTNVSHEFRTPLSLVISPLQKMMGDETDPAKHERLSLIHRNAQKLLGLVNQLLDMRKLDANSERLNKVSGDVVNYVRNICQSFSILQDKHIELVFNSEVDSLRMSFDEDKLGKIMNNLLSNAFKFTPPNGKVKVNVGVRSSNLKSQDFLNIEVADTGIGISNADKEHIFERFYQVENRVEHPFGGSGIGLSLTKDFVEMHGGTISVADNPGGGTVFTVLLPVESLSAETTEKTESAEPKPQASNLKEVLIVDDSQDFLDFMSDVLSEQYSIRTAHNGIEALKEIGQRQPDIILSDVMMPEMDGNELCRKVKQNPQTARIPFVMLTARLAQEHEIEGMESGADDYITKPFNLDLLNLRIANLIRWREEVPQQTKAKIDPHVKEVEITSLDHQFVQAATDYVEQNISNTDMTVESLSEALNMSRVHLYKRMLSLTGSTPSEFIRLIRLQRAEQLLRQSQLSVSEISFKVGFNNPRYFSKYFKEMYGMMPSQYKAEKGC